MSRKRFTEEQVRTVLDAYHAGERVPDLCRLHQVSERTLYLWLKRHGPVRLPLAGTLEEALGLRAG